MQIIKNIAIKSRLDLPIVADFLFQEDVTNQPIVIFCHGYKGFKDWGAWPLMCQEIAKQGNFVVAFNFSHNGGTLENPIDFPNLEAFGNDNFTKQQHDLQSVIDTVTSEQFNFANMVNKDSVCLIGHSRGGGAAILKTATEKRITKLITLASIASYENSFPTGEALAVWQKTGVWKIKNGRTKQEMPHYIQFYEDYLDNKEALDISNAAKKINVPHLIVHGNQDTSVNIDAAHQLKQYNPSAETFYLDTNHVFGSKHPWESKEMPMELSLVTKKIITFL